MGKFDKLAKALGIAAEDLARLSPDVVNTLEKVDTPEMAVALKGAEREKYLNALDKTYGDKAKRAADMGFGKETYYHGSTSQAPIESFDISKTGARTDAGNLGQAVYVTPKKFIADAYSSHPNNTYPLKINKGKSAYLDEPMDSADITNKISGLAKSLGVNSAPEFKGSSQVDANFAKELTEKAKAAGLSSTEFGSEVAIYDPTKIRSTNAAFDPRFKNSSKLLAGVSAAPAVNMGLEDSFKNFREDIAKPLVSGWEKVKSVVTEPLSKQLNLSKDPSVSDDLKTVLDIGLDPTNLLGGVPGVVAGGLQMMGSGDNKEEIAKRNALKKLQGDY